MGLYIITYSKYYSGETRCFYGRYYALQGITIDGEWRWTESPLQALLYEKSSDAVFRAKHFKGRKPVMIVDEASMKHALSLKLNGVDSETIQEEWKKAGGL